jgi:hypothetical protein
MQPFRTPVFKPHDRKQRRLFPAGWTPVTVRVVIQAGVSQPELSRDERSREDSSALQQSRVLFDVLAGCKPIQSIDTEPIAVFCPGLAL